MMHHIKTAIVLVPVTSVFAGQCSTAESALWIDHMEFTTTIQRCAVDYMGGDRATANCIKNKYAGQLSDACAACFGQTVKCGVENCAEFCTDDAGDPACLSCTFEKGCDDGLNACTGFSQGPPKPFPANAPRSDNTTSDGKAYNRVFAVSSIAASLIALATVL